MGAARLVDAGTLRPQRCYAPGADLSSIITGEAVVLELRPASFAARALGLILDVIANVLLLILLIVLVLSAARNLDEAAVRAMVLACVVFSFVIVPVTVETLTRGRTEYLCSEAGAATRIPWGHPEGYLEAFANVYLGAIDAIRRHVDGAPIPRMAYDFPSVHDGCRGVQFIHRAVESANAGGTWVKL